MKIALIGYGKMGRMIEQIAISRGHEIVCRIDVDNPEDFDSTAFRSADVAIEFTAPAVAYGNVTKAFDRGVKVVSGSTGWFADHETEMRRRCTEEGKTLFWASNFSVGVAIFRAVNRYLARLMNEFPEYKVSMQEVHHVHKLDHPSGTAITLAEEIVETHPLTPPVEGGEQAGAQMENLPGDLEGSGLWSQVKGVPIESIRRGEVPGIHSITWDSEADSITITHDAHSRKGFALGAVLAAEYTAKHTGLLTTSDLFNF
jgi:4-hydroxy-tetrahydrodipicolinate reductase